VTDSDRIGGFLAGTQPHYNEILEWITVVVRSRLWNDHVNAEDVIADTLTRLLTALREGEFQSGSSLKTYVQQITLYTLIDATRRQKRFVPLEAGHDPTDHETPYTGLTAKEEAILIERAIALLPEGCRTLFTLVLEDGLSCREIAERIGTSEGAVKTRLSRCRQKAVALMRKMR
jgi:RNA polymerase sigma-70 factor (ECF subfamily)